MLASCSKHILAPIADPRQGKPWHAPPSLASRCSNRSFKHKKTTKRVSSRSIRLDYLHSTPLFSFLFSSIRHRHSRNAVPSSLASGPPRNTIHVPCLLLDCQCWSWRTVSFQRKWNDFRPSQLPRPTPKIRSRCGLRFLWHPHGHLDRLCLPLGGTPAVLCM